MKINKIDVFLITVLILTIAFITTMTLIFCRYQAVPDSLIAGFFALVGGECGILGWIKHAKERRQDRIWSIEDRERDKEYNNNNGDKNEEEEALG